MSGKCSSERTATPATVVKEHISPLALFFFFLVTVLRFHFLWECYLAVLRFCLMGNLFYSPLPRQFLGFFIFYKLSVRYADSGNPNPPFPLAGSPIKAGEATYGLVPLQLIAHKRVDSTWEVSTSGETKAGAVSRVYSVFIFNVVYSLCWLFNFIVLLSF